MGFATLPGETITTKLAFALLLRDRLTLTDQLAGTVTVTAAGRSGWRKDPGGGTFVFDALPDGAQTFQVRSSPDTPYYGPADIAVTLPAADPLWPAFPDIGLADKTLQLSDPAQPAAYRSQFLEACLAPTVAYPFDPGATLLRGTVLGGGSPVAGATVADTGGLALPYTTGPSGEFVLAFPPGGAATVPITVTVTRSGMPDVDVATSIRRSATTSVSIDV